MLSQLEHSVVYGPWWMGMSGRGRTCATNIVAVRLAVVHWWNTQQSFDVMILVSRESLG